MQFIPYSNESDVVHIAQLMIENRLDRITFSGALDVTADRAGLARARQLQQLLNAVVAALEAQSLPEHLPAPVIERVDNPFN